MLTILELFNRKDGGKFVYKHTETTEYIKNSLLFKKNTNFVNNSRILRSKNANFLV